MNKIVLLSAVALLIVIYILITIYGGSDVKSKYASASTAQAILSDDLPSSSDVNSTYSMWFYIQDWSVRLGTEKTIIERTDRTDPVARRTFMRVFLGENENTLGVEVLYNPRDGGGEKQYQCTINNIPIQKWVNVTATLNDRALDVYLDGKLTRTCIIPNVPVIPTNADLLITPDGGFKGFTSNIQYNDNAKNPTEVYKIYKHGYNGDGFFQNIFGRYRVSVSIVDENDRDM